MKKLFAFVLFILSFSSMAGSWQMYVDDQLMGTGFFNGCVIMGHDGNTWASKNLSLVPAESYEILRHLNDPGTFAPVTIQAETYTILRSDHSTLGGRTYNLFFWSAKTLSTVILCVGSAQHINHGGVVVERLALYLRDNGY